MAVGDFPEGATATHKDGRKIVFRDGEWRVAKGAAVGGGKPLPDSAAKRTEEQVGIYSGLKSALNSFQDDYGGNTLTGSVENKIQGLASGFGTPGQRDWWAQFQSNDNMIRNDLFGAALTASEQAAYRATTIDPSMDPAEIRRNLTRRSEIVRGALGRKTAYLKANGYRPEAVDALLGEYAADLSPSATSTQEKGGDPASVTTGATDGSGTPPSNGTAPPGTELKFNDQLPEQSANAVADYTPEQRAALAAVSRTGSIPAIKDLLTSFGRAWGGTDEQLQKFAAYYADPKNAGTAVNIPETNNEVRAVDPGDGQFGALTRGAANALTLGFADEIGAVGRTVTQGGTFADNLDQVRGEELYDEQNYGGTRLAGQFVGALPFGGVGAARASTLAREAGVAALRSGAGRGAAEIASARAFATASARDAGLMGAAYGFGDTEGGLVDRAGGAAAGGAFAALTGGAASYGGSRFAQRLAARTRGAAAPATRTAADAYGDAQGLGINLPLGATNNRAAAIADQVLLSLPGSANVMQRAGDVTRREVTDAARTVAGNYGDNRGTFEAIGEAAQSGARAWNDKFDRVAGKAYDAIPIRGTVKADVGNTAQFLDDARNGFQSNFKFREIFQNGELERYREALRVGGGLSWEDLKAFRSIIGEKVGEFRFSDGASKSQLRGLYGALSEDMRATAVTQGPAALGRFNRANDLYRAGQNRIDGALTRILGDDGKQSAEAAGAFIDRLSQGNKSSADIRLLREVKASLPRAEWGDVAGNFVSLIGQPANSQGRDFSVDTFTRRFGDLAPEAADALFGTGENRKLLNQFVRTSKDLARAASVKNNSNTATVGLSGAAFYSLGNLPGLIGQVVTSYGAARLLTHPPIVRWLTGYNRMLKASLTSGKAPTAKAVQSQAGFLTRIARAEPAIAADVLGIREALIRAVNGAPARAVAQTGPDGGAPVEGEGGQQQPVQQEFPR